MALAGQRLEILVVTLTVLFLANRIGIALPRLQLIFVVAVAFGLMSAIATVRSELGRDIFYSATGPVSRIEALFHGIASRDDTTVHGAGPLVEFGLRMDSNAWTGNVAEALAAGKDRVSVHVLESDLLTAVPSALLPSKLDKLASQDNGVETSADIRMDCRLPIICQGT